MPIDEIKDQIQSVYRELLKSRDLVPRYGQRQMIAEILNTLAALTEKHDSKPVGDDAKNCSAICVVEAGTGTGKTLAYLLATLPLAQRLGLKVVVSTATIALQEQVVLKDIPEILQGSDMNFKFSLAKGRGRYVCLARLDTLLRGGDSQQAMLDIYGEDLRNPGQDTALYEAMLEELNEGSWLGDRDDWSQPLSEASWRPLTVDNAQCSAHRCSHFRNCCFYQARQAMDEAECIVANHDLVLSDLALGGGVILPPPEETIYIFDEAHHLPFKSNQHFSASARIKGTQSWLERSGGLMKALSAEQIISTDIEQETQQQTNDIGLYLDDMWQMLSQLLQSVESVDSYENRTQYVFPLGEVPAELRELAEELQVRFARLCNSLESLSETLRNTMEDGDVQEKDLAEQWYPAVSSSLKRAAAQQDLWASFAAPDAPQQPPTARWVIASEEQGIADLMVASSPVLAADNLATRLWQNCAGAVLTSATLASLGSFELLQLRAGLPPQSRFLSIPSPFDFATAASFLVPRMNCDPASPQHTAFIVEMLPELLSEHCAALMLFTSRKQMHEVMEGLDVDWRDRVLCQDDYQKSQLLSYHKQRVDRGEGSLIFGLSSFAEGVDLPGKYCTHVLIAKIPFAVPNDPIELTLSEWLESQGKNAFMTLAVPDAAFRLVQASGRLLRNENDKGQITLFDERIVTRRYGKAIMDSLPPYRRMLLAEMS